MSSKGRKKIIEKSAAVIRPFIYKKDKMSLFYQPIFTNSLGSISRDLACREAWLMEWTPTIRCSKRSFLERAIPVTQHCALGYRQMMQPLLTGIHLSSQMIFSES